LTEWFSIGQGTRQGCNISPTQFNLYAEDIIRRARERNDCGVTVGGRVIDNLRYADDTTLLATTEDEVRKYFDDLVEESRISNMTVNAKKTNVMVASRKECQVSLTLDNETVKQVDTFKFLGSYKTSTGDCTMDIKRRIGMARAKAVQLDNIWRNRHIGKGVKIKLMKTLIWPIFMYGSEGWTIKKSDENRISAFEMWCWRRLIGVSWRDHRTNESVLEEMGLKRELLGKVRRVKLQYFGHVARGSAGELSQMVMEGTMEGTRYQGAPRMQWIDNIKAWTGHTIHECKTMAQDREQWRKITRRCASFVAQPP
jgi:hypothetical protein